MFIGILTFNNLGSLIPALKMVTEGQYGAGRIFTILNTKSKLTHGGRKDEIVGNIEFKDVRFSYPIAKETEVLKGLNFTLNAGERLGIVGSTGSGKSTVIQLLLKYYEPIDGTIFIDGNELNQYDISYLRENIAVVSQEPMLFNFSIYENIRFGKMTATSEEIEKAAELAGALDFIRDLPDKFETMCGTKGSQLSGGQKQRIAIARAIIRNPKILLLDEATSALDRTTESIVTKSLESALHNCTRITVAQNLLTIKDSTTIIMIEKGEVIEKGSHKKLMKKHGAYHRLYKMQELQMSHSDDNQIQVQDSDSVVHEEQEIDIIEEKKLKSTAFKKMMLIGKSEKKWLMLGSLGSLCVGIIYPLTGLMSGLEIANLGGGSSNDMLDKSIRYGYIIFIFAVVIV